LETDALRSQDLCQLLLFPASLKVILEVAISLSLCVTMSLVGSDLRWANRRRPAVLSDTLTFAVLPGASVIDAEPIVTVFVVVFAFLTAAAVTAMTFVPRTVSRTLSVSVTLHGPAWLHVTGTLSLVPDFRARPTFATPAVLPLVPVPPVVPVVPVPPVPPVMSGPVTVSPRTRDWEPP
jgi:hypothetical protein